MRSSCSVLCLFTLLGSANALRAHVPLASAPAQPPTLRLLEASVDVLVAAGASSADGPVLETLQGGGHDPQRDGFTLQQAELSLSGAVDPIFKGQAHVLFVEDGVELEEAYLTTREGLGGWDFKAGYFHTEFGRFNTSHLHTWSWVDQPLVNTRLLGGEGLRAAGARVGRLLPLPWYSEIIVGVQNAGGEFAASFLGGEIAHDHGGEGHAHEEEHEEEHHDEEGEHGHEHEHAEGAGGIGGRAILDRAVDGPGDLLYSLRWTHGGDLTPETTAQLGFSGLVGPNASGESTDTWIAGTDLTLMWTPAQNPCGFPFVRWDTEFAYRHYEAGAFTMEEDGVAEEIAGDTLKDYGLVTQLQVGFTPGWVAGLRGEWASGSGESVGGRDHDPYRADRIRLSPLLSYQPSEFSRVRLQYNYDDADHLDESAHTVWISLEALWGTHPAHTF
jgi:hypothetical protein